ncbi:MAG: hypothetical protein PHR25_00075 [Clostridia bacterium]|nr:hypothetical protein [Clostridia bacterium]MDD4375171.1 hypothetical protein [Clostridia bacterium]
MGRTYSVPRSVKGESRILYIFSIKSLMFTIAFGIVGLLIGSVFSFLGLRMARLIITVIFAAIGFGVGALVIPDSPIVGILRKAGGEPVSDILIRTITFKKRKKIYIYREGGIK